MILHVIPTLAVIGCSAGRPRKQSIILLSVSGFCLGVPAVPENVMNLISREIDSFGGNFYVALLGGFIMMKHKENKV